MFLSFVLGSLFSNLLIVWTKEGMLGNPMGCAGLGKYSHTPTQVPKKQSQGLILGEVDASSRSYKRIAMSNLI